MDKSGPKLFNLFITLLLPEIEDDKDALNR
jgi:hypothetical protein